MKKPHLDKSTCAPHCVGFRALPSNNATLGAITDLKTFFFRRCWAKYEDIDVTSGCKGKGIF